MYRLIFLFSLLCFSFGGLARAELVTVDPDNAVLYNQQQTSWSSRVHYYPYGKVVEGIPISKINKKWCSANTLRNEDFPEEAQLDADSLGKVGFVANHLDVGRFKKAKASVGVARNCNEDSSYFFILFTAPKSRKNQLLHLEMLKQGETKILYLGRVHKQRLTVWWCGGCDVSSELDWSKGKFEWLASGDMGE